MRASVIVPLILAALFGLGLRYGSGRGPHRGDRAQASPPAPRQIARTEPKAPVWEKPVTGEPRTNEKDAIESALREAGQKISDECLKKRNPPVDWVPTPEFLQDDKHKIVKAKSFNPQVLKDPNDPTMLSATLDLELSDSALKAILEQDRHYRVEQRLWFLGRGLAGIVLVLGAIAGAIRLDEWTKGYFPLPLKLGVVALALVGAAAMWAVELK